MPNETNEQGVELSIAEKFKACSEWTIPSVNGQIDEAKSAASKEAEKSEIFCDEHGLTQSMYNTCASHAHDALRGFQILYSDFIAAIAPYMDSIKEVNKLEEKYASIDEGVILKIADEKSVLASNPQYENALTKAREADARYAGIRKTEKNRDVRNPAKWLYMLLLILVGFIEVLLNYQFLLEFMGVPAFAFGAAVMAGWIVAWAAHEHGKAIKQHNFYFGSHVRPEDKVSIRWQFIAASVGILVALIAIYFSRYIAVSNAHQAMLNATGTNILSGGSAQDLGVSPAVAALVSLLFNMLVWGVSVWIATGFHDHNPHYMDADNQKKRADRNLAKVTKTYDANVKAHNASKGVERQTVRNELQAMTENLGKHLILYRQIEEKKRLVLKALTNDTNKLIAVYKRALIDQLSQNGHVHIYDNSNEQIPVEQYAKQAVSINQDQVETLIHW